jgi:small subunit ribosomal protein S1
VVAFGAFVEVMEGVEGLVHISELAQHHVENPREIVNPGDVGRVKILEIDEDRRRLSLSFKRVEDQILPIRDRMEAPGADGGEQDGELGEVPELGLSEDVFSSPEAVEEPAAEPAAEEPAAEQPAAEEPAAEAPAAEAPAAEEQPAPVDAEPPADAAVEDGEASPAPDAAEDERAS